MNQIEKVARAMWPLINSDHTFDEAMSIEDDMGSPCMGFAWVCDLAKAAIAAMQPAPQEPVAWLYEYPDFGSKIPLANRTPDLCNCGWTETPLYAHPTPPAGGSDAE